MDNATQKPKASLRQVLGTAAFILVLVLGIWLTGVPTYITSNFPINTSPFDIASITLWANSSLEDNATTLPDFKTTIIATGIVDPVTGEFTETAMFSKNDRVAVKFKIRNAGNIVSPKWIFNVKLPTVPFYVYLSEIQKPLKPNKEKVMTIFFDQIAGTPTGTIEINADPTEVIEEISERNNVARAIIIVKE